MMGPQNVQPYLFFEGRCEEALEFYKKSIGAKVIAMMRYRDSPDQSMAVPGMEDKIIHSLFQVGDSSLMASDGEGGGRPKFEGFALSITAPDPAEAERLFTALVEGGTVQMPLAKTFFSPSFGMLTDRFGLMWMIYVPQ
jgi:PhnB protein